MLDSFTVMHRGGAVLWEKALSSIKGNPVNDLIRTVLLEERSGETNAKIDSHFLKWALVNEFDLIFVVGCYCALSETKKLHY
jgi:signal recognition particle receptor subunit alpha